MFPIPAKLEVCEILNCRKLWIMLVMWMDAPCMWALWMDAQCMCICIWCTWLVWSHFLCVILFLCLTLSAFELWVVCARNTCRSVLGFPNLWTSSGEWQDSSMPQPSRSWSIRTFVDWFPFVALCMKSGYVDQTVLCIYHVVHGVVREVCRYDVVQMVC